MTQSAIERLREADFERLPIYGRNLTRALVAEGERERLAELLCKAHDGAPWTWSSQLRDKYRTKADAIHEHFAAMALGEGL